MDVREFKSFVPGVLERMRADGYCDAAMATAEWSLGLFAAYCEEEGVGDVDSAAVADYCAKRFGIDANGTKLVPAQAAIRKPLLTALELYSTGSYVKSHRQSAGIGLSGAMKAVHSAVLDEFIGSQRALSAAAKKSKTLLAAHFLAFLDEAGVSDLADLTMDDVDRFAASLDSKYAKATARAYKGMLRELLDWMQKRGMVGFPGRAAFPDLRSAARAKIISHFTKDEVERVISCIDNSTAQGKRDLALVSLFALTGIRAGDALALDLSDIDWDEGVVRFVQQKTGEPLALPLPEEVVLALADYIRNARPDSAADPDALFITAHAPHTRVRTTSSVHRVVGRCMAAAGVVPGNRSHGPHSLRHSLATNMLADDVPVHAISDVLGHGGVKSTEVYLTVDVAHARGLALEVPL